MVVGGSSPLQPTNQLLLITLHIDNCIKFFLKRKDERKISKKSNIQIHDRIAEERKRSKDKFLVRKIETKTYTIKRIRA